MQEFQEVNKYLECSERVGATGGVTLLARVFSNGCTSRTSPSLDGRFCSFRTFRLFSKKYQKLRTGVDEENVVDNSGDNSGDNDDKNKNSIDTAA